MKNTIKLLVLASLSFSSFTMAGYTGEQVWNASVVNTQKTCGIDYADGASNTGGILTSGEQGTDNGKAVKFLLKANTANVNWSITESHLVGNAGRFDFADDLTTVNDRSKTSVFVNNTEYSWAEVTQPHSMQSNQKTINVAAKINMDRTELPVGETKIQSKLKVVCSD